MTTATTPQDPAAPLTIWPLAQTTAQYQRTGRYWPGCTAHPGKMLPEFARRIVTEYSTTGQVVLDPLAGIGTTLVEAALLDRRGVGVELEDRWVALAEANLDHVPDSNHRLLAQIRIDAWPRCEATPSCPGRRSSRWNKVRKAGSRGVPRLVTAHEDLLVFRVGVAAGTRRS
ncbi:MAG: DNA methyltransferase [Acidimicrobiales bacterium]|jgi:hypothetical protein